MLTCTMTIHNNLRTLTGHLVHDLGSVCFMFLLYFVINWKINSSDKILRSWYMGDFA
jgi:hypothetical protein